MGLLRGPARPSGCRSASPPPALSVNDSRLAVRRRPIDEPELVGRDGGDGGVNWVDSSAGPAPPLWWNVVVVVGVLGCCWVPLCPPRMVGDGPRLRGMAGDDDVDESDPGASPR